MRVLSPQRLTEFGRRHADARIALDNWYAIARVANWGGIADVRRDFPAADGVTVASRRTVTVFNVRGNNYRLVTAIHYSTKIVFAMRFMTHADYSRDTWKESL